MVKTQHAIESISSRIPQDESRVPLRRVVSAEATGTPKVIPDPAAATAQALSEPLDFPPLAAGVVPGDRVAIAVDENVPCAGAIVRGAIDVLRTAGIDDASIAVVTTTPALSQQCKNELGAAGEAIQFVVHDPEDADNLCFVGLPKRSEPLLLNRTIYDADVVLPIGCARRGGRGPYDGLFPAFAGAEDVGRYRSPAGAKSAKKRADQLNETNEAGWLIGVLMVIEVVPGPNDSVAHVVAGEPKSVGKYAARLFRAAWTVAAPERARLVVANLNGGPLSRTWDNVARALAAARRLVADGGAIVIGSNMDEPPGRSLERLVDSQNLEATERRILRDHSADSLPAWRLARALQRGPVYFLSQLDAETVDSLGMAPVADIDELVRLAGRQDTVIVLDDAQHAVVKLADED